MAKVFTPPPKPMLVYTIMTGNGFLSDEVVAVECCEVIYAQEPGQSRAIRKWMWYRGPNNEVRDEHGRDLREVQAARFSDLVAAARAHAAHMALLPESAVLQDWYQRAAVAQEGKP